MSSEYDGPTLRSIRESMNIPLRRVARIAKMSHGHLSKVERGEHGRPVTPAILSAYEGATGIRLNDAKIVGFGDGSQDTSADAWRRGRLSDARRLGFNASIAGLAVGGPLGEPVPKMLDSLGRFLIPEQLDPIDAGLVEGAARLATVKDLTCGGGLASQLARAMLRWSVGLARADIPATDKPRLYAAIGQLAHRAGWSAFDADRHDAARAMFSIAMDASITAGDRDLRAHVLADVAAQHNYLGYPHDAIQTVEMAESDLRVCHPVRMVLYGVKARAYASTGEPELCKRYIGLAEDTLTHAVAADAATGGWQATMATPAHLHSLTGHAAASLAHRTETEPDRTEAVRRLTAAVEALDTSTHPRMFVLCAVRLAALHLTDQSEPATAWAKQAIELATHLRSGRVGRAIGALRAVAAACGPGPAVGVVELIDAHRQHRTQRDRLIYIERATIRTGIDPAPTSAAGTSTVDDTGEQEGQR